MGSLYLTNYLAGQLGKRIQDGQHKEENGEIS